MNQLLYSLIFSSFSLPVIVHAGAVPNDLPKPVEANAKVKINLNLADVNLLTHAIKGIGAKRAQAIVAYRNEHHEFKSLDELAKVPGIGKHFVETHKANLEEVFTVAAK
ncbi:MAG: hypothetical protein A3F18_02590 [Legionellales bacterium RIFCSPHIGHO2_12_FULL_37_14]|nr:MAG: hypothetical protein A3F18_02590 [Legionellales bacterium RIFCSPHIGHO2_12_FULL_37_14]